jgi:hypothetical protein
VIVLIVACVALAVSLWALWTARASYYRTTDRPVVFAPCSLAEHVVARRSAAPCKCDPR